MIQLSILRINDYGPWTLTQGSDREHKLQMLQASLYGEVQRLFSERDCLAFHNRADEFFVASNALGLEGHIGIQGELMRRFDVRLTVSIGRGASPLEANRAADRAARDGLVLDREHLIFGPAGDGGGGDTNNGGGGSGSSSSGSRPDPGSVSIMHLDVDSLAARRQTSSPYEISCMIFELYARMSRFFLERDSLAFFMGGDNFMVVAGAAAKESVRGFMDAVSGECGISLNCGIGNAPTARRAAALATRSLDTIREIRDSGGADKRPRVYEMSC